jgi:hypothetical protein
VIHLGAVHITFVGMIKLVTFTGALVTGVMSMNVPLADPWFDLFLGFYIFSAITSGMPEPTQESSFGYIWMYRSFHILSANGTAYFIARNKWNEITGADEK